MSPSLASTDLEGLGLSAPEAGRLAKLIEEALERHPRVPDPEEQVRLWTDLRNALLLDPASRRRFDVHLRGYRLAYAARRPQDGPGPAWTPRPEDINASNLGRLMAEQRVGGFEDLRRWSADNREAFWAVVLQKLAIAFVTEPDGVLRAGYDARRPNWFPGARLNIAESCFRADLGTTAIVSASEASPEPKRTTYGELRGLADQVAEGLSRWGLPASARVALYMPMTTESVAIYLGVILSGRCVVGIADTSAPEDLQKRLRISGAAAVVTIESYLRDGKVRRIYDKVTEAKGPKALVLPSEGRTDVTIHREEDRRWREFLGPREPFEPVPCRPSDYTNILFSSGTTKDPKAIPWTHTTPIRAAADAYLHHDVRPGDVLAWPTSFGWMMGPWLTYASLVNRATMALYVGAPQRREFGEFVSRTGVTMLGVVPKLVRSWKADGAMEGLDWGRIRAFSSTAEPSTPEEMLYLMFLAGYKPVIEYCGGTEVGGGYLAGTVVQRCAPATFTTPTFGLDVVLLDEGKPADRGEVFLVPPSIGLSTELLNYDHDREYFAGLPSGPRGEILRRHGDQVERLGGGFFRHLGRIDDMININGVKTSAEEIRGAIQHDLVYDSKPLAVDVDGSGQHRLVVFAVPRDSAQLRSGTLADRLRQDFQEAIKTRLSPLLAHVHDVVLVPELPQAGPGKTLTMKDLRRDYLRRRADG